MTRVVLMIGNLGKYIELTKPKVTLLNLLVGVACFVLGVFPRIDLSRLCIFFVVGYLSAGGCGAINCVYDSKIDSLMPRTSKRAIPSGFVQPKNAFFFGAVLFVTSITLSQLFINTLTTLMVILGGVFYILVYTILLKRTSAWNVVVGGLAGSFAALSGWTAAVGSLSLLPLLVSLLDFIWTPGHLWGLAIKKMREYGQAGIPMLPVTVGLRKAAQITFLVNFATVCSSLLMPLFSLTGLFYMVIAISSGLWFLLENCRLAFLPSEANGFRVFLVSVPYLAVMMVGLVIDKILLGP